MYEVADGTESIGQEILQRRERGGGALGIAALIRSLRAP